MLSYTKPYALSKVRYKEKISENDIVLAKVDTLNDEPVLKNIGASYKSSGVLAQSNIKSVADFRFANNLSGKTDPFPNSIKYDDGAYKGTLKKLRLEHKKHEQTITKVSETIKRKYMLPKVEDLPPYLNYKDEDGYRGKIGVVSVKKIKDISIKPSSMKYTIKKNKFFASVDGSSSGAIDGEEFYKHGTSGIISTVGKIKSLESWQKSDSNGQFPPTKMINGRLYTFTGTISSSSSEAWVKHYGFCRYWGGGENSSNNYYGDPDYRFKVDGGTAKGYMKDQTPAPTLNRYDHSRGVITERDPDIYPVDCGGFWGEKQNEIDGILWTYDVDEAVKYGGKSDEANGGAVWASAFSDSNFPPSGYSSDHVGDTHLPLNKGNNGTIDHRGIIVTKNGAQKTSRAGFYNAAGWYCKWFRDVILFYKGKTVIEKSEGLYTTKYLEESTSKAKRIEVLVLGVRVEESISEETTEEAEEVTGAEYEVEYRGDVYKTVYTYSAVATYIGEVCKEYFLGSEFANPIHEVMYANSSGKLTTLRGSTNMSRRYIEITNVEKDGVPLFYKYICSKDIDYNISTGKKLVEDACVVSGKTYDMIFSSEVEVKNGRKVLSVYSNKEIDTFDNIFVEYISNGKLVREKINTVLAFNQGIDFSMSYKSLRYEATVSDSKTIQDDREKIDITYSVRTNSGLVSSLYSTSVVNRLFATSSEKAEFINNLCPVSSRTAKEILANDLSVEEETLDNETFYIKVHRSSGVVDAYVDDDGLSRVYFETLEDTGSPVGGNNTGRLTSYVSATVDGVIRSAYYVRASAFTFNVEAIRENVYTPCFAKIDVASFIAKGTNEGLDMTAKYDLEDQEYSSLGMPYRDTAKVLKINKGIIEMPDRFLKVREHIEIDGGIKIKSFGENFIEVDNNKASGSVSIRYKAIEDKIIYKGFEGSSIDYLLDLNVSMGHKYTCQITNDLRDSSNLLRKSVYIFIRPQIVTLDATGEILIDNIGKASIYHKIEDPRTSGRFDSLIGVIYVTDKSHISVKSFDSRIGGGIKEKYIENNVNKFNSFFDIASYTEKYIKDHSTIVSNINKNTIDEQIYDKLIKKHLPLGILDIVK